MRTHQNALLPETPNFRQPRRVVDQGRTYVSTGCRNCGHQTGHYRVDNQQLGQRRYILSWNRCPVCFSVELESWKALDLVETAVNSSRRHG